jgi:signal transduction histidine kinase
VSGIFERLRSLPITTQVAMLVAAALAIAHVLIGAAVLVLYPRLDPMYPPPGVAIFRLCFVAKLLDTASSPDQRAEVLRIAHGEIPDLGVGELPRLVRRPLHGPHQQDVQSCLGEGLGVFDAPPDGPASRRRIAIRLHDGSALTAPLGPPPGFPDPGPGLTIAIVFLACAVVLLSIWATRTLTAPLTRFTEAAERFTLGRADKPLPERGPREIVRAAQAFNRMRERIQGMVKERAHMLAAVSHDLRTPITRLRLRAEEIEQPLLKKQVIRDLDTMRSMVHAALSFLRGQASRGKHDRIDLPSLIQTVCDDCADTGREVIFEGASHLYVNGDSDQLARAITNLIENGLKFGTAVAVTLSPRQDRAVEINVRDDGPGIPDGEKHRVLEPFYRRDHARGLNSHDSFGLGLSISQVIAEAHGGSLSLHDAEPTGLIARLTLPLAASEPGGHAVTDGMKSTLPF